MEDGGWKMAGCEWGLVGLVDIRRIRRIGRASPTAKRCCLLGLFSGGEAGEDFLFCVGESS